MESKCSFLPEKIGKTPQKKLFTEIFQVEPIRRITADICIRTRIHVDAQFGVRFGGSPP